MAHNRIPLALAFDENTGNASGLVEFTLSSTDFADFCSEASPTLGQALVWSGTCYGPSTIPAGGGDTLPTGSVSNVLAYNGAAWFASSLDDLDLVSKVGNQSISGTKTFADAPIFGKCTPNTFATIGPASATSSMVSPGANSVLAYGAGNFPSAIPSTADMLTFLGTTASAHDLTNVSAVPELIEGTIYVLQWVSSAGKFRWLRLKDSITNQDGDPGGAGGSVPTTSHGTLEMNEWYSTPPGVTGKGDLGTGFVYVSGTSSTQTTTKYASTFGQAFISGSPNILGDSDNTFIYLSGLTGETVAGAALNAQALSFMGTGDHGGLNGLGDDDHPQYVLSATNNALSSAYTNHAASASVHFTEGSIDHGSIAGLGDNDHPQYLLSATAATTYLPSSILAAYSATVETTYLPSAILASYSATVNQYSGAMAVKTPYVLYTSGGESSTAYEELFSFTIPGNALGTHGSVHVDWGGDVLHPAGLTGNTGVKVLLNGTNVISNSSNQIAADNDPYPLEGNMVIGLKGEVGKQRVTIWTGAGDAGGSTGDGGWLYGKNRGVMAGDGTEDTRSDLTVSFQVKFTVSDATHFFRLYHVRATLYPDVN